MMRGAAQTFRDLVVWQKAHEFVLAIYGRTEAFPKHELYGLTSQVRRAAVSRAANIAEGFKKSGRADKVRFLNMAPGALEEYDLILAADLGYGNTAALNEQLEQFSKLPPAYSGAIFQADS